MQSLTLHKQKSSAHIIYDRMHPGESLAELYNHIIANIESRFETQIEFKMFQRNVLRLCAIISFTKRSLCAMSENAKNSLKMRGKTSFKRRARSLLWHNSNRVTHISAVCTTRLLICEPLWHIDKVA